MTLPNCDVFIPVRLNSSRLPQKHLHLINGKPALLHLIERLQNCKKIRQIIVCTTNHPTDDLLVQFLDKERIKYFRGNEKDILQRFLDTANKFGTDIIIDVEGDKIYTDPFYVDEIAKKLTDDPNVDFVIGNDSKIIFNPANHFIHGFVPAGIRKSALQKICKLKKTNNTETGYREFFLIPGVVKFEYLILNDMKFPENVRLTLDYNEDLELAQKIFTELGTHFNIYDIISLFNKKPELTKITESIIAEWKKNYEKNQTNINLDNN